MSLKKYRQKRNFAKTPEPAGKVKKPENKPFLFVVQKHAASHLHYDFRLELKGVLKSWAVPKGPSLDPKIKRLAMHVEDHPLEYGDFEGIIPKGQYGGGTVMVWDTGEWLSLDPKPYQAYLKGNMSFELKGQKLKGRWKLIRLAKTPNSWLLIKAPDNFAKSAEEYDISMQKPKSVISHKTMEQIAKNYQFVWGEQGIDKRKKKHSQKRKLNLSKSPMPEFIFPQLATLVNKPPVGEEWIHEIKFDGYRLIAIKRGKKVSLFTRRNNDWTDYFSSIVKAIQKIPITNAIFDGEIVVLDENKVANFQLLQNSIKNNKGDFIYYIFDLTYYQHYDLTRLPLIERKHILQALLKKSRSNKLLYSDHIQGEGAEVFKNVCAMGLEGIVSKNINSPYLQKRTHYFLKTKCTKRQEFIIGGFTAPKKSRRFFGSLLVGSYNAQQELIYNGHVGTGFTEDSLKEVYALLKKYQSATMPFKQVPSSARKATWLKPILVAEIEFSSWTEENILRQPSFKGLRQDKAPRAVTKEEAMPIKKITGDFNLSNPDKALYPEIQITKRQLAIYYESIEQWILPYVKNRPLTLVRCPNNYHECFYQKHFNGAFPEGLHSILIKEKDDKDDNYIFLKNSKGLFSLVQLGVLEIHPWGSKITQLEKPDILIFDLDPAPEVKWKEIVDTAFLLRELLKSINLKSFVKTTGGKGLHVVIPIKPKLEWEAIKNFSHTLVNFVVAQNPQKYIGKMTKKMRTGKIFIDYLRNQRGATAIAPYSTRARPGAPVATPIHWDELTSNIKDTSYNIKSILQRLKNLKQDPWKDFFNLKQSITLK